MPIERTYWAKAGRVPSVLYGHAYSAAYGTMMRLAHRFNWHHATICHPDGDTLAWCQWCGLRAVIHRGRDPVAIDSGRRSEPTTQRLEN